MYPADAGNSQSSQQADPSHRLSWDPNTQRYPPASSHPNGAYPPRPDQHAPPPAGPPGRHDRPDMAAIHPQHAYQYPSAPPYQLPAPQGLYAQPGPPHDYRPAPHQAQQQQQAGQSAPRQRTAIACKYCRRRKIRCSGFENSEDGRCSNCVRFSQECVFTPVSAQTQAFVPAQALYGRGRGGPPPGQPQQLYGPYGNRLPPTHHDPYGQPPPPPPPGHHPGYTLPSPSGNYPPPAGHYHYPPAPGPYEHPPPGAPRHRSEDMRGAPPNPADHRDPHGAHPGYGYPDPHGYAPPTSGYQSHPQPYYTSEPTRRHSPNSAYSYDPSRHSQSPHGPAYGYPPSSAAQPAYSSAPSAQSSTRTPPPLGSAERGRSGMSIHDIVGSNDGGSGSAGSGERNHADNDMLSKLNRPSQR